MKINRTSLDEFAKQAREKLEQALKAPPARPGRDDQATTQAALGEVFALIKPIIEAGQKARQERNGGIDTKFSYFESFKKCGNWDQGNIWLDGRPKEGTSTDAMKTPAQTAPQSPAVERDTDPFGLHIGRMAQPPKKPD